MKENMVMFKGVREGLRIHIDSHASIDQIISELKQKLGDNQGFFDNARVRLFFTGKKLSPREKKEIVSSLLLYIDIDAIGFDGVWMKKDDKSEVAPKTSHEGVTRFFRGTLRSGQRIDYVGNIIVMGDVNPGAEIIAGGNVIVLGNLRGMAHAGAKGDFKAIVMALCLQPTQLRIGNIITRSPEGDFESPAYPEIAYIKGDNLLIEPYNPGDMKY